jgi:basic membrane protein A and related proteins
MAELFDFSHNVGLIFACVVNHFNREGTVMTDFTKRSALKLAAVSAAMATVALVGCGKKETPPPPAPAAAAPAAAPKAEPLKAAWVYVGPVGDAGWTFAHDLGRKAVEAKFGDKVKTSFVEKVPEGPDAERVIRDLAQQGNKIIFATSFGYMEPMLKVAKDFPDVKFEHATGYKTADNMRVYDARFYQDAYMAGMIAGKMTKSNTLGFVGSFPIPEVLRNINAYTLGAQSVNPKVKTKVVWVNTWFDPPKESEAAQALINGGADVLLQNTDSTAVLQTAEKAGKSAFGWDSDMSGFAPKAHLGSAIVDWSNYYTKSIQEVMDKTWKGGIVTRWGVKEGQNDMIKIAEAVPAEIKTKIEEAKKGIKEGTFEPFTGPIVDNTGKERLAKDAKADDEWKGKVDFYVKGVEGKIPSGK